MEKLLYDELPIVHFVLNTDCNAWDLAATTDSPGVCRFCYRERNRVVTDAQTVRRVLEAVRGGSAASRIVFTGGDPIMPYDNHLEPALMHAASLGFEVNIHTNGLLLAERYHEVKPWVTVFSLAVDGADAATADWFRGQGYFTRFNGNLAMLVDDGRTVAFNTFTSPRNVASLPRIAEIVLGAASETSVEYWLISQYRPIGRSNSQKAELYGFPPEDFQTAVEQVRSRIGGVALYSQPTRKPTDPYPFRVWVLADGTVTADLGSVSAPRNIVLGNALVDGFAALVRQAISRRASPTSSGAGS